MADIHLLPENGEATTYPEDRIAELLRSGHISPETLYWREGMADWEPIATYRAQVRSSARRTEPVPVEPLAGRHSRDLAETKPVTFPVTPAPRPVQAGLVAVGLTPRPPKASRRPHLRFRRNPWPATVAVEFWLLVCLVIALLELTQGVDAYQRSISPQAARAPVAAVTTTPAASSGPAAGNEAGVKASGSRDVTPWEPLEWSGWAANLVLLAPYFIWLHRTVMNCRSFSSMMYLKPGLAIGNYFIPFVNLFRPCQDMQEIWRVSGNPRSWLNDRRSVLVGVWWVLVLTTIGVSIESWALFSTIQSHDDDVFARLFFVIQKGVQVLWYVMFIALVALVMRRQARVIANSRRGDKSAGTRKPAADRGANGAARS
jgi:hypothetical protein